MYLNWYHNFFQVAKDIGVSNNFEPKTKVRFMHRDEFPNTKVLEDFGSPSKVFRNLFSGVIPVPDMFLYMYSVIDLLGTPMAESRFRDLLSVNGFASTKYYATNRSVRMFDEYLAKTFGVSSYELAARTFKTFVEYGAYCPQPLYQALIGDCYRFFLLNLEVELQKLNVNIQMNCQAKSLVLDKNGVAGVVFERLPKGYNPSLRERIDKIVRRIADGRLVEENRLVPDRHKDRGSRNPRRSAQSLQDRGTSGSSPFRTRRSRSSSDRICSIEISAWGKARSCTACRWPRSICI